MSDDETTVDETTVVVETVGAPVAPQWVTPGELDARLELHRTQIGQDVQAAVTAALDAREVAEAAADEAAVATVTAEAALSVAAEAAAEDDEPAPDSDGADGPTAPKPRSAPAPTPRPERRYGADILHAR